MLIEFDIHRIKADAVTQFTSAEFQQACADSRIAVSLAAPKHQEQNHYAERSWQSVKILTDKIMVYARLPPIYKYHATLYAIVIYNVTPVKELCNKEGNLATPYELFFEEKPRIAHLHVFYTQQFTKKNLAFMVVMKSAQNLFCEMYMMVFVLVCPNLL